MLKLMYYIHGIRLSRLLLLIIIIIIIDARSLYDDERLRNE